MGFLAACAPRCRRALLSRYWTVVRRPSAYFSLGFLTVGGFVAGILFWGAFNTALEATNTETFCIGSHEMRDNVYVELPPRARAARRQSAVPPRRSSISALIRFTNAAGSSSWPPSASNA
jgi:hypothetical protein